MQETYQTTAQVSPGGVVKLDHVPFPEGWMVNVSIVPTEPKPLRAAFPFGLHAGMITMSDDFNEPLPDSFWLGEENDEPAA
ncbi:hypothetical protein SAMN02745166_04403 [Prosthecobacter debontii]|uniref:Uncharacterized protein n=1 Tax=Prosthecobacter debontii TaxID=48467 RepID=A0A1T4YW07_9BACT|nr:hypothetical protein [Prosthecobacter debontii]SKB06027.1 hypothetical protein SAMN02745166_04403 [Prosthecobacter debontii]